MRANRRTDTKPELALRHALHRLGYRYRKDYRLDLDGGRRVRPDIAFTARKVAVFVDGCFWHACPEHGSKPRANEWYWGPKLIKNVERDRVNDAALILAGWTVVRLWEHVPLDEAVGTVVTALTATVPPGPAKAAGPVVIEQVSERVFLVRDRPVATPPSPSAGSSHSTSPPTGTATAVVPVPNPRLAPIIENAVDHGTSVDVSWRDRSGGKASFIVIQTRIPTPKALSTALIAPGTTTTNVDVDPKVAQICVQVVAYMGSDPPGLSAERCVRPAR